MNPNPDPVPPRRRRGEGTPARQSLAHFAIRLVGALLLYLAHWIVIPPPTYSMLVLAVGAPELSPLYFAIGLLLLCLVLIRSRKHGLDRIALACSALTLALAAIPLVQIPGTIARFDRTMKASLGESFDCAASAEVRHRMRPAPIALKQFVTGIAPKRGVVIERGIEFTRTADGPLALDLYRPAAAGDFPIVIQVYGGAWRRGEISDDHQFAEALARAGYVVVAVDYRHAPKSRYPAQVEDIAAALHWARTQAANYQGDIESIALLGRSSGAELALVTAFRTDSSYIKAAISYYGPVDLTEGFRHPPRPDPLDIRPIQVNYLGGTPDDVAENYRNASPITWVRRGLPPTLLIHGDRDHVVEPRFAQLLHDSLAALGDTAVLLRLPWSEHAFDKVPGGPGSQIALYEVERFLGWVFADRRSVAVCR